MRNRVLTDWLGLTGLTLFVYVFIGVGDCSASTLAISVSSQHQPANMFLALKNDTRVDKYSQSVRLDFQDKVLSEVLQAITKKTGVSFKYPPRLSNYWINATINARGWEEALKELLADYDRIEIWGPHLDTTTIILLGYALQEEEDYLQLAQDIPDLEDVEPVRKNPPAEKLIFSNLPPNIRKDPQVVRFLYENGVALPQSVTAKYGTRMEKLPPPRKMFYHLLNHVKWRQYLKSLGLKHPIG